MLARMILISWPRDPPASASQSAGITGISHHAQPRGPVLKRDSDNLRHVQRGVTKRDTKLCPQGMVEAAEEA